MVITYLNRRDLEILCLLVELITCSSYRLSKLSKIPAASTWRALVKLKELGLVNKEDNSFKITARGLVICYFMTKKKYIKDKIIERLKEAWNYDCDKTDLKLFLNYLQLYIKNNNISPFYLCYNEPISLAYLMIAKISNLDNLDECAKKVIGKLFLKTFPNVTLPNGCRAVISYDSEGKVYGIALDCKISGIKIFHYCPLLEKEVKKLNDK